MLYWLVPLYESNIARVDVTAQLGVRLFFVWHLTQPGDFVLVRKNWLVMNWHGYLGHKYKFLTSLNCLKDIKKPNTFGTLPTETSPQLCPWPAWVFHWDLVSKGDSPLKSLVRWGGTLMGEGLTFNRGISHFLTDRGGGSPHPLSPHIRNTAHWVAQSAIQNPSCNYHCFMIAFSLIKLDLLPQNRH